MSTAVRHAGTSGASSHSLQHPGGKRFDALIFIGRFQPPHRGHIDVLQQALRQADRVCVLIGSTDKPCTFRLRPEFAQLVVEFDFIASYKRAWAAAPYPGAS